MNKTLKLEAVCTEYNIGKWIVRYYPVGLAMSMKINWELAEVRGKKNRAVEYFSTFDLLAKWLKDREGLSVELPEGTNIPEKDLTYGAV